MQLQIKAKEQFRHTIIYQQHFEIKLLILQMSQKEPLLDDGDNDDWKSILMGILNVLKLVLCIYSLSFLLIRGLYFITRHRHLHTHTYTHTHTHTHTEFVVF